MSKPLALLTGLLCVMLAPLAAWSAGSPQRPYVVLDKSLAQLRADFNANVGKVRLLYIVGPTCGTCLRGLSDLERAIYAKKNDDPRLVTFVVHVPTLGAREKNVAPASRLISNAHTMNYWEETGIIGKLMQQAMGADVYLWDFWTVYDPQVVWSDKHRMPVPGFWQHQLSGRLPADRLLDASVFASQVEARLAQVPVSPVIVQTPRPAAPGGDVPKR
jgi:hypothetical protein